MLSVSCDLKVLRCTSLAQTIMLLMCMAIIIMGANGQVISTSCSNSIVNSFTPCFNFITGSTLNGSSSPTQDCCDSLKSIMTNMIDCACLIVTGNVPFSIPFVRTLVLSLPLRQCNSGVPVQCKGSGAPLPAPGPVLLTPAYNSAPAYSPRPHHHHPARPPRPHPPALAPHSSRVLKDSVTPSPAPSPPPAAEQPKKKPVASNPPPVEASKEKGAATPPLVPKKIPGMSPVLNNPSKTAAAQQPNSSPISSSFHSLWLLLFVISVMFVCQ